MDISIGGMIGLYGGMLCGLWGWWYGRKKAREQRGLDEVHEHIWQKARSYSWYVTLVNIYILFSLIMFGITLNTAMILGLLLLIHLGSWAFIGMALTITIKSPEQMDSLQLFVGIGIIVVTVITITILTIILSDWRLILIGMPLSLVGLVFLHKSKKVNT